LEALEDAGELREEWVFGWEVKVGDVEDILYEVIFCGFYRL